MKLKLIKEERYRLYLYLTGIGALTFLVYHSILKNRLLDSWDDQLIVMNSYTKEGFTIENIWFIMTDFYAGQYAPFNEYLYLALYSLDGYNPFSFHLASLLLHLTNSYLVFITVDKLLSLSGKVGRDIIPRIAILTSIFFCIHPLNVESVAWMSASKILVYAMFYLLATYTFLLYLESGKTKFYVYTIILYIFSFLGKEQAVVFPLWMLLIYSMLNYNLSNRKLWIRTIPFFLLSIAFGVVTIFSQYPIGSGFLVSHSDYPLWQRIIYGCYSYLEYLFKIILPFKLSYLYPFPVGPGEPFPGWMIVYPVIILITLVSLWRQFFTQWWVAFGMLFFTIHISIALHIIPMSRFAIIADRYAYVAIIGIGAIIAHYFVLLYNRIKTRNLQFFAVALLCSYLFYLGTYAHQRTYTWYNVDTLKKEIRGLLKKRNDYQGL